MGTGTLRRLIPCALLLVPVASDAPTSIHAAIHSYSALAGKFAFIQPDGSLTVLDSATGKVLFRGERHRDERYSWNSFFDTPHGLVVRSYRWKLLTRDESVYRRLDFERQEVAWEVANTRECHVGEDYLICPDWRGRLVARRLADGRELWTYRPESATGEVLDRKGRVLVTAHDEDSRWRAGEDGTKLLSSRDYVRALAILDGRTGKELRAARDLDVAVVPVSYGGSAFSFDGERVVVDVISWDGACAGRLLRTFTPRAEGTDLVSEERCAPADERSEGSAARDRIAKTLGGFDSALAERDGKVFVDRPYGTGGKAQLDCLDAETGAVLWSYAFPPPTPTPFF
jgi:outer membrane protein assembly factor BamB